MDYKELGHIYYSDHELYEIMYKRRFSSIYTHHINHYEALIIKLPYTKTSTEKDLYSILIQVELFSEHGISTMDLIHYLGVSRGTVNTKLMKIEEAGFLKKNHIKRENFFGIDLQALDRYVDA